MRTLAPAFLTGVILGTAGYDPDGAARAASLHAEAWADARWPSEAEEANSEVVSEPVWAPSSPAEAPLFVDGSSGDPSSVRRLDAERPRIAAIALDDGRLGNGNGRIDPGETLELALAVENDGLVDLEGATLVVRGCGRRGVAVREGRRSLPVVSFGEVIELDRTFLVTMPSGAPCGAPVSLEVLVRSAERGRLYRTRVRVEIGSAISSVPRFPLAPSDETEKDAAVRPSRAVVSGRVYDSECDEARTPVSLTVVAEPAEDGSIDVLAMVENRTATRLEGRWTLVGTLASGRERGRPGGRFALAAGEMTMERFRLARGVLARHGYSLASKRAGSTALSLAIVATSDLFGEELGIAYDRVRVARNRPAGRR